MRAFLFGVGVTAWVVVVTAAVKMDDALARWVQRHPKIYASRAMLDAAKTATTSSE